MDNVKIFQQVFQQQQQQQQPRGTAELRRDVDWSRLAAVVAAS